MTTIAQAFNAITVAQGGTPKGGTIVDAIDALTDTLAGSDQPKPQTIAEAVTLLGEHIGGGGGGSYGITVASDVANGTFEFYNTVWDDSEQSYVPTGDPVTSFQGGSIVAVLPKPAAGYGYADQSAELWVGPGGFGFPAAHIGTGYVYFVMPSENGKFYGEFAED